MRAVSKGGKTQRGRERAARTRMHTFLSLRSFFLSLLSWRFLSLFSCRALISLSTCAVRSSHSCFDLRFARSLVLIVRFSSFGLSSTCSSTPHEIMHRNKRQADTGKHTHTHTHTHTHIDDTPSPIMQTVSKQPGEFTFASHCHDQRHDIAHKHTTQHTTHKRTNASHTPSRPQRA